MRIGVTTDTNNISLLSVSSNLDGILILSSSSDRTYG